MILISQVECIAMTAKTIRNVSKLNYALPFVTARRLHNSYDSGNWISQMLSGIFWGDRRPRQDPGAELVGDRENLPCERDAGRKSQKLNSF